MNVCVNRSSGFLSRLGLSLAVWCNAPLFLCYHLVDHFRLKNHSFVKFLSLKMCSNFIAILFRLIMKKALHSAIYSHLLLHCKKIFIIILANSSRSCWMQINKNQIESWFLLTKCLYCNCIQTKECAD